MSILPVNTAPIAKLARALPTVLMQEAAVLSKLALPLKKEAARRLLLPLLLRCKGAANKGLLLTRAPATTAESLVAAETTTAAATRVEINAAALRKGVDSAVGIALRSAAIHGAWVLRIVITLGIGRAWVRAVAHRVLRGVPTTSRVVATVSAVPAVPVIIAVAATEIQDLRGIVLIHSVPHVLFRRFLVLLQ